jgi:hypothetical protein
MEITRYKLFVKAEASFFFNSSFSFLHNVLEAVGEGAATKDYGSK